MHWHLDTGPCWNCLLNLLSSAISIGPFQSTEMAEWFSAGYFTMNLLVKRGCDEEFMCLGDVIKRWGRVPFVQGPEPPPLAVSLTKLLKLTKSCVCYEVYNFATWVSFVMLYKWWGFVRKGKFRVLWRVKSICVKEPLKFKKKKKIKQNTPLLCDPIPASILPYPSMYNGHFIGVILCSNFY